MKLEIKLQDESRRRLKAMPGLVVPALFKGMKASMYLAEREAKLNLSGRVLNRRTGRLRSSVTVETDIAGDRVMGRIGSNVIYARIHELGGDIFPKRAKALKFQIPGVGWRTAQKVTMPERPFLRPAIMDNLEDMSRLIGKEIETAFRK